MIAHILLEWLVAQRETKSALRIHIDGFLQIEFIEGNYVFRRLHPILFHDHEMKLAVDEPVIVHVEDGPVLQKELRDVWSLRAINIHGGFTCRRSKIGRIPLIEEGGVVNQ